MTKSTMRKEDSFLLAKDTRRYQYNIYNLPTLTGIVKSTQVMPPRTTKICTITASEMQGNPLLYGREVVISKKEETAIGQGLVMEHSMSNIDQNGTAKVMIINNSDELECQLQQMNRSMKR